MEKDRKFKTIGIVSVLVAIVGLSIAFAALSQTLTINGTAEVEKRYNISVKDLTNIDLSSYNTQGIYSIFFIDQNEIPYAFSIIELNGIYYFQYNPNFDSDPNTLYYYDSSQNNWREDGNGANTIETELLVFTNVRFADGDMYASFGVAKLPSSTVSDLLSVTESQ